MANTLQQQLDSMTPDQAIGLMAQAMGSVQGSRVDHMLLAKAEELIVGWVKKGLESVVSGGETDKTEGQSPKELETKEPMPV